MNKNPSSHSIRQAQTACFPEQPDTPFPEQADSFLLFRTHILIQQTYPFPECDNRTEKRMLDASPQRAAPPARKHRFPD
ncbi:hypothetical protein [Caecibacteroides pullorum]|uniref:Uncharacterized protein n=1 Tax=Caecibacteroides pullorum TaxID=2725562 RepID=A0AA41D6Z8_9BACT|nr:hypothetical protein [Caecibacteroides pullorum]MBM6856474.1 hypothetical protein [Caecibacteroides pullorum]MBV8057480.1 hypothetical protein [Caecibacteroides pullorum]